MSNLAQHLVNRAMSGRSYADEADSLIRRALTARRNGDDWAAEAWLDLADELLRYDDPTAANDNESLPRAANGGAEIIAFVRVDFSRSRTDYSAAFDSP